MEYLKKMLGIEVEKGKVFDGPLPNFIRARYRIQRVRLNGQDALFLYPRTLEQIETLKKHIVRIQAAENVPVVLVLNRLTSAQREGLLRARIPFIVEGKQIYLPFLAVYLPERCDAEPSLREEILPSAQMLLLYFIYHGALELPTSQAAKELGLTATSISRASRQLVEMQLVQAKKVGVQKILFTEELPKELYSRAKMDLLNPVKRKAYIPKKMLGMDLQKSGYSALAEYSMLNAPNVETYAAASIASWKDCVMQSLISTEEQAMVERWRYDPKKLSQGNAVDVLSLALSLQEDGDERVEEAVEEMLEQLWRKLDGYRNAKL